MASTTPRREASAPPAPHALDSQTLLRLRAKVHRRVVDELQRSPVSDARKQERAFIIGVARAMMEAVLQEEPGPPLTPRMRQALLQAVLDEVVGFGPLQALLDDPDVAEIIINAPDEVFVEKLGRMMRAEVVFDDDDHILRIVRKILAPIGRRVDEASPMVDARLPDGSRVNVVVPPVALKSPLVTIRKRPPKPLSMEELIANGTLSKDMANFLRACVEGKLNIIVSGGPGSGKTTTLRALTWLIPEGERIITIEDSAELWLERENLAAMEARPASVEGIGQVTIGDLVKNALRMRPNRIVIGEVRGGEAFDMLQAMNTGTEGSMTTMHSNAPRDTIARLEAMCLMAGIELPAFALARQIASAIHLIVHQSRLIDGSRKIVSIAELVGMDVAGRDSPVPLLQEVFVFEQTGLDTSGKVVGQHRPCGVAPKCLERLKAMGIECNVDFGAS